MLFLAEALGGQGPRLSAPKPPWTLCPHTSLTSTRTLFLEDEWASQKDGVRALTRSYCLLRSCPDAPLRAWVSEANTLLRLRRWG